MKITKMIQNQCEAVPEEVGYSSETILIMDEHLKKIVNKEEYYAGSYMLQKNGKTIASKSMGALCGFENKGDFKVNSIRKIASITKTFTAVAIMQLIEDGKIHIDQPVAEIIEEFDNNTHRDITIFHILTHTSGLPSDPGSYFEPYPKEKRNFDNEQWIKQLLEGPLRHEPGKVWAYSSASYCILGEIIARKSGMPYDEYIINRITKPLGMERTFFTVPDELMEEVSFASPEERELIEERKNNVVSPVYYAGGGLLSTVNDMAIYGQMLLNKGTYKGVTILSRKSVEAMVINCIPKDVKQYCWGAKGKSVKFGLGFDLNQNSTLARACFNHEGFGWCGICLDIDNQLLFVYSLPSYDASWEWQANLGFREMAWSGLI